jgi:hypothetical protein
MAFTAEGMIEIDMADFTTWIYENYLPAKHAEFQLGVPRVNKHNQTLEVDFAMGTECNPKDWFMKPEVFQQWEDLK